MSSVDFQTDALRPSSLPTATLGRRRPLDLDNHTTQNGSGKDGNGSGKEEFEQMAEEWNLRIDKEVKAVSSGLKELIELADIGETPNVDAAQINALHLKLKTSQLIRSAQGIRDIAHDLKLMLLLSNQVEEVTRRDKEALEVGKEVEEGRRKVGQEVARLLSGKESSRAQSESQIQSAAVGGGGEGEESAGMEVKGEGMEVDGARSIPDGQDSGRQGAEERIDDRMEEDEDDDEGFEQVA